MTVAVILFVISLGGIFVSSIQSSTPTPDNNSTTTQTPNVTSSPAIEALDKLAVKGLSLIHI